MTARVLVIQPAPHAPLGRLGGWWEAAGLRLDVLSPSEGDAVPAEVDHDALVVMGGSMGANDDDDHPWLSDIKALLARTAAAGVPTLGVCLGHQLLAVALGGVVRPNPAGITAGVQSVGLLPAAAEDALLGGLPQEPTAVQWNDDIVVRLPPGATVLASADNIPQAFRVDQRAWGVQFHPEADAAVVQDWAGRDVAAGSMAPARADELLTGIRRADAQLVASWRPWAERFAAVIEGVRVGDAQR